MRGLPCVCLVGTLTLAGCHAFTSLEDCSGDSDCPLGQRCHPDEDFCEDDPGPLVLGASLPLSGDLGEFGRDIATGLELAEAVTDAGGGVLGRALRFDVRNDETATSRARENVESLIEARVAGIVGPLTSTQALETQELTFAAQLVQISPTAGAEELSTIQPARDRFFFRTISTARRGSAAAIALFARSGPDGGSPCRRMAILHSDDAIGLNYRDAVGELFGKLGGCVVARISFPATELVDYGEQASALVEAAPDCATIVAYPEAGAELMGEVRRRTEGDERWNDFLWLGTTSLHGQAFLDASRLHPQEPAEGVYGGDEDTTPIGREYNELREEYDLHFGREPGAEIPIFVSNTYDAAMLLALAIQKAGGVADRLRVRDALWEVSGTGEENIAFGPLDFAEAKLALARGDEIHYKGASSSLVFDDYGTVSNPSLIWKVEEGVFTVVRRFTEEEIEALDDADEDPDPACE
ncbi:MAG: ABC transporter substrate-binding protein [Deltaproteobacteria bacterium]|nr:ABC transporter substrate-binding protein [Deltaproteobacteria bacterium]